MKRLRRAALALFLLSSAGCTETPVSQPLRSLERSGEVSFVCTDGQGKGYDINSCPDYDSVENPRQLVALVTQTLRGEVAVVNLSAGGVVDLDRSTPGFNFIPTGANPIDIVSTPGGVASFVGVGEVQKYGIFGIPSTCTVPPAHDLTAFPACALPVAPGEMAIVIDPPSADEDGDPLTPAPVRATCDTAPSAAAATPGTALAATREECPADLALEQSPPGRRKLVVTLPALGGFAVIDAQGILDREPGSYQPCDIERFIKLDTTLPAGPFEQKVPDDLVAEGCTLPTVNYGTPPDSFISQPAGIDLADAELYIADRGVPLVHRLDLADPCAPRREPPLLPKSFESQNRVVTTSQVAVSPPTSQGERFAYAIDDFDGSVMAFEVTPGHSDRTPIVRPGSPRMPFEPPDRIAFGAPARDVTFALRDVPVADPETGVATIGTYCDPNPAIPVTSPAAKYRPSLDYSKGAAPRNLRGVFGFAMLASGQVSVIDVEDFDAPCRRPITTNPTSVDDFRGCAGDPADPPFFTLEETVDGKRTVSGEVSCRVVEPHRARSGRMLVNGANLGVNAPALRSFPRLRAPEGGNLPTDQSDEGINRPKLLAVDFENPQGGTTPAEVFVGTTLYKSSSSEDQNPANLLPSDPATAERSSVALMLGEPRAFGGDEDMLLEYEGAVVSERKTGFPKLTPAGKEDVIADSDASFCNRGVQDSAAVVEVGKSLGVSDAEMSAFVRRHTDYVQITQPLPDKDSSYWNLDLGATCGGASGKDAFFACRDAFGTAEAPTDLRDFRIAQAYQDRLVVEPRRYADEGERDSIVAQVYCCFGAGSALSYEVRAGHQWVLTGSVTGFRHDIVADSSLRCVHDCNPRRKLLKSRAFEISSKDCIAPGAGDGSCAVGAATSEDVVCVLDKTTSPVAPPAECVFQSLTHRFAIYRGNQPTERDMAFTWTVSGGFTPLVANLAAQSRAVSPQSLSFVPQIGQLAVADGASEGLVLISLDSVSVSRLFF